MLDTSSAGLPAGIADDNERLPKRTETVMDFKDQVLAGPVGRAFVEATAPLLHSGEPSPGLVNRLCGRPRVRREHWIAGIEAHELRFGDGCVAPTLRGDAAELDLIASMIAGRMIEHVFPLPTERLRLCQGPNCSWLFIDSSKAGRRRWCDRAVCGNAAKSRRFYARSNA